MPPYALAYSTTHESVVVDSIDIKAQLQYERDRQRLHKGADVRKKLNGSNISIKRTFGTASAWRSGNHKESLSLYEARLRKKDRRMALSRWEDSENDIISETDDDDLWCGKENKVIPLVTVSLTDLLRPEVRRHTRKGTKSLCSRSSSTSSLKTLVASFDKSTLEPLTPFWPQEGTDISDGDEGCDDSFALFAPGHEDWSKVESEDGCLYFTSSVDSCTIGLVNHEW